MAVKKSGDRWYVVKADGSMGKRGFLTRDAAEASQAAGKRLGSGSPATTTTTTTRRATVPTDPGTRPKGKSTLSARVAMEPVLNPRASDLASLLEGFVKGLEPGAAVPDFTSNPTQDSDDVQIGRAMGDSIGAYMASLGMTKADWKRLTPEALPEGPGVLDGLGLGGGVVEAAAGLAGQAAGSVLGAVTGGIIGGDEALIDVIPGDQSGPALQLF